MLIEHIQYLQLCLIEKALVSVLFGLCHAFLTYLPVFNRDIVSIISFWLEIIFESVPEDAVHVDVTHFTVGTLILPAHSLFRQSLEDFLADFVS